MSNHSNALIFDIKRDCSEDGPGIRTTVFFKGCPLSCIWCHNPEGMKNSIETDSKGREIGEWVSIDELMHKVIQDKPFYNATGGGVTLSGGEPTAQMEFNHLFLKRLKAENIHTAIETSGLFNYQHFKNLLLPWLDVIYFDLKLYNDADSVCYSGEPSKPIFDNFRKLSLESGITLVPRIPLIPGITTTNHNLRSIAQFLRDNKTNHCLLVPYNPLWFEKKKNLGQIPMYKRQQFMDKKELDACVQCMLPQIKSYNKGEQQCKSTSIMPSPMSLQD